MPFLRSVFISAFVTYIFATLFYGLAGLYHGTEPMWSWVGLALSAFGPSVFFIWVFAAKPVRTQRHPIGNTLLSGIGLAITMLMSWRFGEAAGIVHIWAGLAFVSWMIYLRWYSPFSGRNASALTVGNQLPEIGLQNTKGETIRSSSFIGKAHILIFYRGNWCPFCMAQIEELALQYREIEAAGATVVLISPQPLGKNQALAKKFNIAMEFFRDPKGKAARLLGIHQAWGTPMGMQLLGYESDSVLPTVVITDAGGKILYSHQTDNYRIRPEPAEFLSILGDKST